jgi:hypothetical protein
VKGRLMKTLENILLGIPRLFLKKIAYAWLGVIFFWHWPPISSSIFMGVMLLGFLLMAWQNAAWVTRIRRDFHSGDARPYIDRPHAPWTFRIRNILLLCAGSAALGWLLDGQFELSGVQWFLLLAGFMLLYKDTLLLGAQVTYILTDQGIGIHFRGSYRPFFKFSEISRAIQTKPPRQIPIRWAAMTPQRHPKEGVLLFAARAEGFSKEIPGELLLAPSNMGRFLSELAVHVAVTEAAGTVS